MTLSDLIKPRFWDHRDVAAGHFKHLYNFRRIWRQSVLLTAGVTLLPLFTMAVIDYNVSKSAIHSEIFFRTSRLVSTTRRTISYYLSERLSALDFVVGDNPHETLLDPKRLSFILENLQRSFQGFVDLGVIDQWGIQRAYVGPYDLSGVNYHHQDWYRHVVKEGVHLSEVFMGIRNEPHVVIAVRHPQPDGSFYIVRTTLDTERFTKLLSEVDVSEGGDAFLVNHDGALQTPSRFYGKVLEKIPLPLPSLSDRSEVMDYDFPDGTSLVIGYAYIENTPFVLMICKRKHETMRVWHEAQWKLLVFLTISIGAAILVILGVSTYLVGQIYESDLRRVATLHEVEYSNKMASIGRLAAGVAHEINNPLAVINEKAGLIKDLFTLKQIYEEDLRLMGLIDSIIRSVERCATITRRLLSFARHVGGDSLVQRLHIREVVEEVLGFLQKEADYQGIAISVDIPKDIPEMECDRGRLQQVLLNIVNNALAAMSEGGHLDIAMQQTTAGRVALSITDDGCGIPEGDVKRIFEPFFSTKTKKGGTGLGLSITYSLVKEMGGQIFVRSQVGQGTTFILTLPLNLESKGANHHASAAG